MTMTARLFDGKLFEGGLFNGGIFERSSEPTAWYLTVVTTAASQDYTVGISAGTGVDIYIDWGDASANSYTSTGQKTHTYASAGTYTVKISGAFASGGNIRLGSNNVNRSRIKATSAIPNIPGLESFGYTFYNCTGITTEIPKDLFNHVSSITDLTSCFMNSSFTGEIPVGLLDKAGDCTDMYGFMKNVQLTGPIPENLFRYLTNCTRMEGCFSYSYNLSNVVPADLLRYVTNCTNFAGFASGLTWTTESYSALLNSMDTYLTKTGVPFNGGNSKYDTSAVAAHDNLTGVKGWSITDGGPA